MPVTSSVRAAWYVASMLLMGLFLGSIVIHHVHSARAQHKIKNLEDKVRHLKAMLAVVERQLDRCLFKDQQSNKPPRRAAPRSLHDDHK